MELSTGESVRVQRVILATGVVDELPSVPGLAARWGITVLHCPYCHGYEMADGRLGVMATGESSLHQGLLLPDWSADVTFFTNAAFSPDTDQRAMLAARGTRVEEREVDALVGNAPALAGVRLRDGDVIALDALFTSSRTRLASPLAERLGCALDEGPFGPLVQTSESKETSVTGVFCAGDAARAWHNATLAVADGMTAGISAHRSLVLPPSPAS